MKRSAIAVAAVAAVAGCASPAPSSPAPLTAPEDRNPPSLPAVPDPQIEHPPQAREPSPSVPPAPKPKQSDGHWERLKVLASAYNSIPNQTSDHPFLGAWGDKLVPGTKVIAVSRDLLKMGLHHNSVVHISGLEGTYKVVDKMAPRWTNTIDIYMGLDVKKAIDWGRRHVTIRWWVPARK